MSKEKGIDISYWQGNIDFKKVKMSDVKFVILREGYRQTMDKKFMDYVFGCRTWGIRIDGVYHFIYLPNDRVTSNSETGILNAQACLQNVRNAQLRKDEIIIWCDLEYDTITHAKRQHGINLSNQDIKEITVAFCNEILKAGYRVGLYTNLDYAKNKYGMDFVKQYDLWLADYTGAPDIDCLYQQYTSEGTVDGISGKVDMNWKFNTKEEHGMGVTAQDVVNTAVGWLGCNEADGSFRKIIDLYNSMKPLPRGYEVKYTDEWCDTFVSAVAIKAGAVDLIGRECGCEQHIKIFKQKGIWQEDGTVRPQIGWIVLYNWDDTTQPNDGWSDHIGYVAEVHSTFIRVIEGNRNGKVAYRDIVFAYGCIRGYACPKYANSSSNKPVQPKPPTSSSAGPDKSVKWTGTVTADSLNVRTWAGTENGLCSFSPLKNGTSVGVCDSVTAKDGSTWYYIKHDSKYGFVHSSYVKKTVGNYSVNLKPTSRNAFVVSGSGIPNKSEKRVGKVTADILNVRTWAGAENSKLKSYPTLAYGNMVSVCDAIVGSDGDAWYYICIANKSYGFVHGDYIQLQ